MSEKIRLDYQMFRWGPLLVKFKIPDDMRKKFLEEAYASDKDYEKNLAGVITKEVGFRDIDMFQPFFHTIFEVSIYHATTNIHKLFNVELFRVPQ